jgi:hypothetical protein
MLEGAVARGDRGLAEGTMRLDLTDHEARMLSVMLDDQLLELRREIARTDARDMRHELVQRQELCEKLLADLAEHVH